MDGGTLGLLGGILGGVLGLLGGTFGTYMSIKNTKTPQERSFVIKYSIALWLIILLFVMVPMALALANVIPAWLQWIPFALFFVFLVPFILWANKRQAALRGDQEASSSA